MTDETAEFSSAPAAGRWSSGVLLLLVATAVSGGAGYAVTWLVGATIPAAAYGAFAVFWSTLYIVVGALGGLQQELTRGTVAADAPAATSRITPFGVVAALVGALVAAVVGLVGGTALFGEDAPWVILPLAGGVGAYTLIAVLSGALYGVKQWRMLAALTAADGVVRLILILIALHFVPGPLFLAWAVVLPFPIVVLCAAPFARRLLHGRVRLDARYRVIARHGLFAVAGAAATAVVVSGFPFLLRATSPGVSSASLAPLILGLTLVRAPLVVPFFALQSFFIVRFREAAEHVARRLLALLGAIIAASAVIAALAAWIGPPIIVAVFGSGYRLEPLLVFVMVLSSGFVGVLAVSGAAVIARSRHGLYATGWGVAALVTVGALLIPGDVTIRAVIALIAGPLSGLIVHLVGATARGRVVATSPRPAS